MRKHLGHFGGILIWICDFHLFIYSKFILFATRDLISRSWLYAGEGQMSGLGDEKLPLLTLRTRIFFIFQF